MTEVLPPLSPSQRFAEEILDSVADGVFTVDLDFHVTSFNRAAEAITGVPRERAIGSPCRDIFRTELCERGCMLRQTLRTGEAVVNQAVHATHADGTKVPMSVSTALLRDEQGSVIGGVETFRDLSMEVKLRRELVRKSTFADIISRNKEMRRIFDTLPEIAQSGATVLVEGPSGSGKELFARAIHDHSPRRGGPMVTINCGALPDSLLESELFGYAAGAFTDARRDKPGRFDMAAGGTLFLDEIGDISPAMQARLLRVLEDGTYEPLGSTRSKRADMRVIAATHRAIDGMVRDGSFRDDLFYRIAVVRLRLPPLRRRKEDIPLLVDHLMSKMRALRGKEILDISHDAIGLLFRHDFPGNVRELENIIEYAFVVCRSTTIGLGDLPPELRRRHPPPASVGEAGSLAELEASFIYEALSRNGFNRAATARELGMHKTTLWRKMKKLGIQAPSL